MDTAFATPMVFSICHPRVQDRWEGDKPASLHTLRLCGLRARCEVMRLLLPLAGEAWPTQNHKDRRWQPWHCPLCLYWVSLFGPVTSLILFSLLGLVYA